MRSKVARPVRRGAVGKGPCDPWDLAGRLPYYVLNLVPLLKDKVADLRRYSAEALGKIGPGARSAVPDLAAALKDAEESVSRGAARALGQIGPQAREAVPALCQ